MAPGTRLKKALEVFERERQEAEAKLARAEEQRLELSRAQDVLETRRDELDRVTVRPTVDLLRAARLAGRRLDVEIKAASQRKLEHESKVVEPARAELRAIAGRCRSIELLLERRLSADQRRQLQREQKDLDELAGKQWLDRARLAR